jgi:hypothetical protein
MRLAGVPIPYLMDESIELSSCVVLGIMHQAYHGWIKRYVFASFLFFYLRFRCLKVIFSTSRNTDLYPVKARIKKGTRRLIVQRINHINSHLPSQLTLPTITEQSLKKNSLNGIFLAGCVLVFDFFFTLLQFVFVFL